MRKRVRGSNTSSNTRVSQVNQQIKSKQIET
jgi:hypothetical protein